MFVCFLLHVVNVLPDASMFSPAAWVSLPSLAVDLRKSTVVQLSLLSRKAESHKAIETTREGLG